MDPEEDKLGEFLYASEYYCEDCKAYHRVSVWSVENDFEVTDLDGDVVGKYSDYEELLKDFPDDGAPNTAIRLPKTRIVTWHLLCSIWIGWRKYGAKALRARPNHGKYLSIQELPQHVRDAFCINDKGYVEPFTGEDVISELESNGTKIKKVNSVFYRITFDVVEMKGD